MYVWLIALMAVAAFFIVAVFYRLYVISGDNIMRMWEDHSHRTARDISYYLTMPTDAVEFSALKINGMMDEGADNKTILDYLHDETQVYAGIINENTTGVYGYIRGEYLDGSRWVAPDDYEPETRPWYIQALDNPDSVTFVDPFFNLQTKEITMSVAKLLNDGKSVVSMDVFMDGIQDIVEGSAEESQVLMAAVIDKSGFVVANSYADQVGKNYNTEGNSYEKDLFYNIRTAKSNSFEVFFNDVRCIAFVEPVSEDWDLVLLLNKGWIFKSLYYIYVFTAVSLLFVFGDIIVIFLHIEKKHRENDELTEEVRAVADVYMDMAKVDFVNDTMVSVKKSGRAEEVEDKGVMKFSSMVTKISSDMAADQSKDLLMVFLDPGSLRMRLRNANVLSHEFMDIYGAWVRIRFFVVERDKSGLPTNALLAFESIDEDRKQQENLRRLSETDMMTGIRNRGSGEKIIRKSMSEGIKGMFVLLDADRFKSVNDDFGHGVGDKVIIALAECMKKTFRDSDIVFRLGGDEFAAFATGVEDEEIGGRIIDRLFKNVEAIDIPELQGRKIEVSVGASFYPADRNDSFEELYARADRGTYESKKEKGNRVTFNDYMK